MTLTSIKEIMLPLYPLDPSAADPSMDASLTDNSGVPLCPDIVRVPSPDVPCPQRAAAMFLLTFNMMPQAAINFGSYQWHC